MAPVVNKWRMRLNARRGAASGRALARARPVFPIRRPPEVTAAIPAICGSTSVVSYTLILSPKSHVWLLRAPTGVGVAGAQKVRARAPMLPARARPHMHASASRGGFRWCCANDAAAGTIRRIGDRSPRGAGRASIKRRAQSGGCDRLCLQRRRTLSLSGIV